jgi:hypothetical protein
MVQNKGKKWKRTWYNTGVKQNKHVTTQNNHDTTQGKRNTLQYKGKTTKKKSMIEHNVPTKQMHDKTKRMLCYICVLSSGCTMLWHSYFFTFLLYHAFVLLEHCVVSCLVSLLSHVGVLLHLCCNDVMLCYICVATFFFGFINRIQHNVPTKQMHGTTKK